MFARKIPEETLHRRHRFQGVVDGDQQRRDRDEAVVGRGFVVDPPEDEFDGPAVLWFREIEVTEGGLRTVYMGYILVDGQLKQKFIADEFHAESGMTEFSVRGVRMGACDEEGTEGNHGYQPAFCGNWWIMSTGGQMLLVEIRRGIITDE